MTDFEDAAGVSLDGNSAYLDVSGLDIAPLGYLGANPLTISVVRFDGDYQAIGQDDIALNVQEARLTDTDDATPAPRGVVVSAGHGGAVSGPSGETVLIGAGALAADRAVSIGRIDLADVEATTGLAAPIPNALQAVGAFHLDLGGEGSEYPVQFAIPLQGNPAFTPGDEVVFLRKGTMLTEDGSFQDTWWLVDNGYIGADGVARTASPPYPGAKEDGDYLVCTGLPGAISSPFEFVGSEGSWIALGGIAIGLMETVITGTMISIIASQATIAGAANYHFGIPHFAKVDLTKVAPGETFRLDVSKVLPSVETPYGKVSLPSVSAASVDESSGDLKLTLDNADPGKFKGEIAVRVLFADGGYKDVQTLSGDTTGEVTVANAKFTNKKDKPFALGSVHWQLVRKISTEEYSNGELKGGDPIEFAGNTIKIAPRPDMAAVLTRTGVDFVREDKTVGKLDLLGKPTDLAYLTGTKVQPVAFSGDLSRVYVGGNGSIYVIDMLTFKLIDTIEGLGHNITSLASSGNLLIIGEGSNYGAGAGNYRLLAMDINPGSKNYHEVSQMLSFKNDTVEASTYGVAGMTIGPDGKTLVVSVPKNANTSSLGDAKKRGDILVFDLDSLDFESGTINAPITATLPDDGISGKAGQVITATKDADRYLIGDVADYNRGLGTLVLKRDAKGKVSEAKMTAIELNQPNDKIFIDRLNIQRAQSAVLVEYKGTEYAIVSDDNYHFNDPYWKAMYEVPDFLFTPSGFPIAMGGSVSAKKVAVGGKLGIVKDPFGEKPEFIGATLPLDGYGIVNLAVSEDGKVLIGQLKGGYSANIYDMQQKPHQNVSWNVEELLKAAVEAKEEDRLKKHIKLPEGVEQIVPTPTHKGQPVGTFFDLEEVQVSAEGKMGDVIGVNLKELAAKQLLVQEDKKNKVTGPNAFTDTDATTQLDKLPEAKAGRVRARMGKLKDFEINPNVLKLLSDRKSAWKPVLELVADKDGKEPVSRLSAKADTADGIKEAKFKESGILFFAPVITQEEEDKLRAGKTLDEKNMGFFFTFKDDTGKTDAKGNVVYEAGKGHGRVTAKDYGAQNTFFGDRPLDDPGYSKFLIKSESGVKEGSEDRLDVYRVEQRLRYLGYGLASAALKGVGEITVDGTFDSKEAADLQLFEKVVRYGQGATTGKGIGRGSDSTNGKAFAIVEVTISYDGTKNTYGQPTNINVVKSGPTKAAAKLKGQALAIAIADAVAKATANAVEDAKKKAKADYERQVEETKQFNPRTFNADGVLEKTGKEGEKTLNWLNAYNAPHWMQYTFDDKTLKGWADKSKGKNQGTSWIYDLMLAGQKAADTQERGKSEVTKLWFKGAGELGSVLNLGINEKYVSKGTAAKPGNQDRIDGNEWLLGLSATDSVDVSAGKEATLKKLLDDMKVEVQKSGGAWNYDAAQKLADLLKNPNRLNTSGSPNNSQGVNNQAEALKDFLTIYTATQNDSSGTKNGSWEELKDKISASNGNKDTILKALFGDGTQAGGLIDSKGLLLGGLGDDEGGIGAKLTKETLAAIMGNSPGVDYSIWVDPINKAMTKFNINTPKRIAAFLANVYVETGQLRAAVEDLSDAAAELKYGYTTPKGKELGNKLPGDAWKYKGRGLIHLTGRANYTHATNGTMLGGDGKQIKHRVGWQTLNQVYPTANYDLVTNYIDVTRDETLAARAGAWYWRFGAANAYGDLNVHADKDDFEETARGVKGAYDISRGKVWESVKKVVYDQNAYGNMGEMLKALGVTANQKKDYNTQFGITLNKRTAVEIEPAGGKKLLAETAAEAAPLAGDALLEQLQTDFDIQPGEVDMLIMDIPDVPPQQAPVIVVAQTTRTGTKELDGTIGVCVVVPTVKVADTVRNSPGTFDLAPRAMADNLFSPGVGGVEPLLGTAYKNAKVTVLLPPKHGRLDDDLSPTNKNILFYPNPGFAGKDKAIFLVDIEGHKVKVVYFIRVLPGADKAEPLSLYRKYCPNPEWWKISLNPAPDYTQDIQPLLTFTGITGSVTVNIADLPGIAVAQTTGEGTDASITFDPTAAGHGWFLDSTPESNEEFLPTSNPNQWIAKEGTEAANKMDLLSVLLHEYGHVLGIEHSADGNDFMAATLQPGVRRLPSTEELALMAQLAGQARLALDGSDSPDAPNPALPLGTLGFALLGRLRRTDYGGWTVQAESAQLLPQYQIAINPTLENGDLADTTSWQTNGNIALDGNGSAVLGESATAQSHLAQGFTINPGDRTLSFTVENDLQANGSNPHPNPLPLAGEGANGAASGSGWGPQDAFEVALLNANTGEALTGTDGLTMSDALLNIQTNGEEHTASSVHKVQNADGSTTYHIDLEQALTAGDLVTGAPALLSFDLIGFGGQQSHVTLRDIRLSRDPLALDDTVAVDEDTPVTFAPLANDLLQSGETPALELTHQPAHGVLTQNPDGTLSYQPDANWNGTDSFSYRYSVTDPESGELVSNEATVTLTVNAVNDAPTVPNGTATIMAGKPLALDLLSGAQDVEGDPLAASILTMPAHGTLEQNPDGTWTYIADITYFGDDAFTYQLSDGQAASAPVTVNLAVTPANTAPVAHDGVLQMNEDGSLILDLAAFGLDAENDTLTSAITAQPAHGTLIQNPDNTWTYTPEANWNGTDEIRFTLSDGKLLSNDAALTLSVTPVNDAPTLTDQAATLDEDGNVTLQPLVTAQDIDGDQLTARIIAGPTHGSLAVNPDGSFSYTPDADYFGTDSFTYRVNDGDFDSNLATVNLTVNPVNDAPVAQDGRATLDEDGSVILDPRSLGLDVDSPALTTLIVNGPIHGSIAANADGTWTYTPEANYNGSDSFTYQLSDGELVSNEATVTFTINAVNDAPTLIDQSATLAEDGTLALHPVGWVDAGNPTAVAQDIDGDTLTARIIAGPAHGSLAFNADGTWTYTPEANYNGPDSYTYVVNDGTVDSNVATVSLTITPVNDAPVAQDGGATLDEDGNINLDPRSLGLDIDSPMLTTLIVSGPMHGSLTANTDGTWTYTPEANFNGTDAFTYQLSDGDLISNEATITLTINAVNDAPTLADQAATLDEDGSSTLQPLATAHDIDGDSLTARIIAGPSHGTLAANPDGSYTYRPDADYFGGDSYSYVVNDGLAGASSSAAAPGGDAPSGYTVDSNAATVNLTVTPVNDAPVTRDGSATLDEDGSVVLDLTSLGFDIDSAIITSAIVTGPVHGSLTQNADGTWTYTPEANYNGADSFVYQLNDGELASNQATVTLAINAVNDAPVARDQQLATDEDAALSGNLLATASDVDGDILTATLVAGPLHGEVTLNADGSFSYAPAANYSGPDSFTYTVGDGQLTSNTATVHIDVTPVADTLSLELGSASTTQRLFDTQWEGAPNATSQSTLVTGGLLDGWSLITRTGQYDKGEGHACDQHGEGQGLGGGKDGFEIWSNGDQMVDNRNQAHTVSAAPGNGQNWLELNDAGGNQHQTLGISRQIETEQGSIYTLGFDLAGRLGFDGDTTRIAIYLDDQKLASYDNTSPSDALDWQHAQIQFTGDGASHTLRIVTDAEDREFGGRGMMLDNIALDQTIALNQGDAGSPIQLQGFEAALTDTDGSETLRLTLAGLPVGTTLSDGIHSFTITPDQAIADITGWNTRTLSLTPPLDARGELSLQITASAIEGANGNTASVTQTIAVHVEAVAQVPSLILTPADTSLSRKLIDTSWEDVCNRDSGATIIKSDEFAGWHTTAVPAHGNKETAFTVWANNDLMPNAAGKKVAVQAASGAGKEWLGLTNGVNTGNSKYQTPGIERKFDTVPGAQYTLSLNYAGGLGLAPENTRIGIYLDGQQIGSYANTSPDSGLDWNAISFSFQGNGKHRELSIQLEGAGTDTPRSAMLDAIQVIETFPNSADTIYGLANTAIRLPRIDSNLTEGDTGAALKTELLGLPKGATLSDGIHQVTIKTRNTVLDLNGWNLDKLTLTPPKGHEGEISLQIRATSTEDSNDSSAAITRELTVKILDGKTCATPLGVNPYVNYLNHAAVVTPAGKPTLVATSLKPEDRSCGIYLPGKSSHGHEEPEDSDKAMENWMKGLEHSLNSAFMEEMERVLRGDK